MKRSMRTYILITCKPGTSEETIKAIKADKRIKGVALADSVYGRFDAVVVVEAPDLKHLSEIVYKVIEKHPDITHTETLITLY